MLRDNLVGLIGPMHNCGTRALHDGSPCLENPRPRRGAESALTERLLLHFRLNQDTPPRGNLLMLFFLLMRFLLS